MTLVVALAHLDMTHLDLRRYRRFCEANGLAWTERDWDWTTGAFIDPVAGVRLFPVFEHPEELGKPHAKLSALWLQTTDSHPGTEDDVWTHGHPALAAAFDRQHETLTSTLGPAHAEGCRAGRWRHAGWSLRPSTVLLLSEGQRDPQFGADVSLSVHPWAPEASLPVSELDP
jgi:hypothetical protein